MSSSAGLFKASILCLSILVSARALAAPVSLFTIERTINANQVVYELRDNLTIHPYWRMLAKDGHNEELNFIERKFAYGEKMLSNNVGSFEFSIVAKGLSSYPITVWTNPPAGHPYATIHLLGGDRSLKRIYLRLSAKNSQVPDFIDFEVQNGDSGPLLYFSLKNTGSAFVESQVSCVPEWTPGCEADRTP